MEEVGRRRGSSLNVVAILLVVFDALVWLAVALLVADLID
jgi:hypothetical protein